MKKKRPTSYPDLDTPSQPQPVPTPIEPADEPVPEATAPPLPSEEEVGRMAAALDDYQPVTVTHLDQLTERLQAPVHLDIDLCDGGPILRIEGRRLMKGMTQRVMEHMDRTMPPIKTDEQGREYADYSAPEFRTQRKADERQGKALAVWLAFPVLRGDLPADLGVDEIAAVLDQKLTDVIIDAAWDRLSAAERVVGKAVDFT